MFDPSLVPIPQMGPLFPRKAGGLSPQKLAPRGVSAGPGRDAGGRDAYGELLREKLKLEGQLEVLQEEAQSTLQERAELQAQVRGRG